LFENRENNKGTQEILGDANANEALFRALVLELLRAALCSTLLYKGHLKKIKEILRLPQTKNLTFSANIDLD